MPSYTLEFVKYLLGLRKPATADTQAELEFLSTLAQGKKCIVEVGVYEGVASRVICQSMDAQGKLYLVDPYFHDLKIEKIFNFSTTEFVAKQLVRPWQSQIEFIRLPSLEAASFLQLHGKADLVFIDARHDYESVLEDFKCWAPMLSPQGVMAFHDSRICAARPDLTAQTGPVRLCNEILRGEHGQWALAASMDSLTVITQLD